MDNAIIVDNGEERLITAAQYERERWNLLSSRYGARPRCPECEQPVNFASGLQTPHFRHEANNEIAQWCDRYSKGTGGEAPYGRIPPPLFIRQKRGSKDKFVIELGLKHLKESLLSDLRAEGATLVVSSSRGRHQQYELDNERFDKGMVRIPFGFSSYLRIAHSTMRFNDIWGNRSPLYGETVFTCDRESLSGRRVEKHGSISYGEDVLIVSKCGRNALVQAFPDVEKVGNIDQNSGDGSFNVFLAKVAESSATFLSDLEISLTPIRDTPRILWPPSLTTSGETIPLFEHSECMFLVRPTKDANGHTRKNLYVHSRKDVGSSSTVPMTATYARNSRMVAKVSPMQDIRFLSTRDWWFSNAILLGFIQGERDGRLADPDTGMPQCSESGAKTFELTAPCGGKIVLMRYGGRGETLRAEPGYAGRFQIKPGECLRLKSLSVLEEHHGEKLLVEFMPRTGAAATPQNETNDSHARKQPMPGPARDSLWAEFRAASERSKFQTRDLEFAMARKALK